LIYLQNCIETSHCVDINCSFFFLFFYIFFSRFLELEWKLVYVGSAEDEKLDQELDSVLVGPVAVGRNKFVFQAPAPDATKIPQKDLMEVSQKTNIKQYILIFIK
jgi:hypothetical protein